MVMKPDPNELIPQSPHQFTGIRLSSDGILGAYRKRNLLGGPSEPGGETNYVPEMEQKRLVSEF